MQSFSDTLGQVFRAIAANKLRSFLTMFGIAWGVGSLLVLVGLGEGFRSGQRRNLSNLGNDLIMMWNGTIPAVANQHTGMRPYELTMGDAVAVSHLPEVRAATVELSRSDLYEVSQWSNTSSHVMGTMPNYAGVRFIPMATGRFLDDADLAQRAPRRGSRLEGGQSALQRPSYARRDHHHQRDGVYRGRVGGEDQPRQQRLATTRRSTFRSPPCRSCFR